MEKKNKDWVFYVYLISSLEMSEQYNKTRQISSKQIIEWIIKSELNVKEKKNYLDMIYNMNITQILKSREWAVDESEFS